MRLASVLSLILSFPALAQEKPREPEDINRPFESPDLDVGSFVERFESESREVFAKRREIVAFVDPKPGMVVADVGAGTGLFTQLFAEAVGSEGKVLAVDIAPKFLEHIRREAKRLGHEQVATVLGTHDSTKLPAAAVDVVFVADTYHHFAKPKEMLASIHQALRPGGRLVIVEFDRDSAKNSEFIRKHVRADKRTFLREIESAGFAPVPAGEPPALEENFIAAFRKVGPEGEKSDSERGR
jgi:predicted methyltransferase